MSGLLPPSSAEQTLIDAARKGEEIDLASFAPEGSDKANIRAEFLRALILQKGGWQIHERGVRFKNARICGQLDLSHCRVDLPIVMRNCEFSDNSEKNTPINLGGGSFHFFDLKGSHFLGTYKQGAIFAERAHFRGSLVLDGCVFTAPARLRGIRIGGQLSAKKAKFIIKQKERIDKIYAIDISRAEIIDDFNLDEAILDSACHMQGIKIGGRLSANGAKFIAQKGYALNAQGAEIKRGAFFQSKNGEYTSFKGGVRFSSAILGLLFMQGAKIESHSASTALRCTNCIIKGYCWLKDGFIAEGAVVFNRANITGEFSLHRAKLAGKANEKQKNKNSTTIKPETHKNIHEKINKYANIAFSFIEGKAERLVMPEKDPPRGIINLTRARVGTLEDFREGWTKNKDSTEEYLVLDGFTYDHLSNPGGYGERDKAATTKDIADAREEWLLRQKPEHLKQHFRPQPWRQIIRVLHRDGMDDAALRLDVRYRRRMRQTQIDLWSMSRLAGWFIDLISHYGRRPWRALRISIICILFFTLVWAGAMLKCDQEGCREERVFVRTKVAEYTLKPARSGEPTTYPDFNPLGFSFDVFIPLFNFGYQDTWAINTGWNPLLEYTIPHPKCMIKIGKSFFHSQCTSQEYNNLWKIQISIGGLLYIAYLLEIFLGAILISIAIAGFTGLIGNRQKEE